MFHGGMENMKGDKYRNLQKWLENNSSERITLTFSEIERILGFTLPESAKTHTEWWANDSSHSQAVWLDAGYKTVNSSIAISSKKITFEKSSHLYSPKENTHKGTIKEIQQYVKKHFGYSAKSCWIADVKAQCGIPVKPAWNRQSLEKRTNPCPKNKIHDIIEALKVTDWI